MFHVEHHSADFVILRLAASHDKRDVIPLLDKEGPGVVEHSNITPTTSSATGRAIFMAAGFRPPFP
jgi:hypothetical protein